MLTKLTNVWLFLALCGFSSAQAQTQPETIPEETQTQLETAPAETQTPLATAPEETQTQGENVPGKTQGMQLTDKPKSFMPQQLVFLYTLVPVWSYSTPQRAVSASVRYHLPLSSDKYTPHKWFGIEFGADFSTWTKKSGNHERRYMLTIPVEAYWAAVFTPSLAGYLKLGLGIEIPVWDNFMYVQPIFQLGLMWHFVPAVNLRLEIGFPHIFRAGFGFNL